MVLCGIWHGASWTFLLWGTLHGIGLAAVSAIKFSRMATRVLAGTPYQLKWFLTFSFIIMTWVVFRAADVATAKIIITRAFTSGMIFDKNFVSTNGLYLVLLGLFVVFHRFDSLTYLRFAYRKMSKAVIGVLIIMAWAITIAASTSSSSNFIYFDF